MEKQLKQIEESYDKAIELGSRGIDLYANLPNYITQDADYLLYQKATSEGFFSNSDAKAIVEYLAPNSGMTFVDLGCCLNLMFRGYDQWPSNYYGVDISDRTIQLLKHFADTNRLSIGALHCCSIHKTPFEADFFDIGACIGVLEYFEQDFIEAALMEFYRIMKPEGKIVLDVPNLGTPLCRITMMIEEHLDRPDKYDLTTKEFEATDPMIQYFLRCKK